MKYSYPLQKIMSLFAGITLTWYVICLPGNSQPQLRVSMGRGMLPPHSREEAVSLPCWLSGMVPQLPPSRPLHLLTSHPLMPLHNKTSNKILALHHGSRTLTIFVGLRLKKKKKGNMSLGWVRTLLVMATVLPWLRREGRESQGQSSAWIYFVFFNVITRLSF